MRFSVVYIDRSDNGFNIHQRPYIDRLNPLPLDANFVLLRQYRAQLSRLIHCRPDVCVVASQLATITEKSFNMSHVKQYNTTVRYLQDTRHLSLRMCKLDLESPHVRAYTDASFSTNTDHSSQLGYIVLLANKHDNACVLHYASYKSRRVARSVLYAETYAFASAFDFAHCAKPDLEKLLDRCVSLSIFTDSKSLFDVITKCSHTQENRLMIDLQAVRDAYAGHDISNVGFIRGPNNPADALPKIGTRHALYHILLSGKCDCIVEQWIICCQNGATPANYSSTPPICYVRSSITDVIHLFRDTTSSYMRLSDDTSLQTVPFEIMEIISIALIEYARTVFIFYSNCTALSLNTAIPNLHSLMPPYSQRGQVISTEMTLETRTYPTVSHERFYHQLRQKYYLRLTQARVIVSHITRMSTNVIISIARAEGSRVDHLPAEPVVMVPRPTVDPYIDYTDDIFMDKRRGLGYGMEPEVFPRVGEYIHFTLARR